MREQRSMKLKEEKSKEGMYFGYKMFMEAKKY